jgi:hypothetical protein
MVNQNNCGHVLSAWPVADQQTTPGQLVCLAANCQLISRGPSADARQAITTQELQAALDRTYIASSLYTDAATDRSST